MASGRMALGYATAGHDLDPTLRPDSRLAFPRPGRQTHGAHRTQLIIFADVIGWIIRRCQTLPVLPHDRVGRSSRAIYPLANLSPNSSTWYFQKCPDARAVEGSGHFRNLPVHNVFLTPGSGPCESHIIDQMPVRQHRSE